MGFTPQFITKLIDNIYYGGKYAARKVYNLRHRQYEVLDSILTTSRFAKPKKCCNLLGTNQHLPFSTLKITGAFSFLRKEKCTWRLYRVHFLTFQINRCASLFGIMSRRANHSQSDRPIANPAECGTHDARSSFQLKRGLYSFLEAVRCLPVCE